DDGTLLQGNSSSPGESSATLILPAARASDGLPTQMLQGETAQAKEVTSSIVKARDSETGKLRAVSDVHTASSAEYLVGEFKRHKRGAIILSALVAVIIAGIGYG
ncbi:MAG: hypothetical protein ABR577_20045, partial [Pyrinomonadaceae bacterium]